jgi:hypothetical protein
VIGRSEKSLHFCVSPVENIFTVPIVKREIFPQKLFKIHLLSAYIIHIKFYSKIAGHYCACEKIQIKGIELSASTFGK